MGKPTGFLEYERREATEIAPLERIKNFNEFHIPLSAGKTAAAGSTDVWHAACRSASAGMMIGRHGLRLSAEQPGARNGMILYITGNWEEAYEPSDEDTLFSGIYFPCLPGTVRSSLHLQSEWRAGRDKGE